MEHSRARVVRGSVCAALGGICWGFSGTCGQYLFSRFGVSTLWLTCVRLLCAGILMLCMALPKHRQDLIRIWKDPRDVLSLFLYGVFGLMMCQYAYMTSISYSNAATTTVLQTLGLVIIMLISCFQVRRLPRRREVLSLLLALLGTFLLATGGDPRHMALSPKGLFWGLATAGAVAVYTLLPRRLLSRWSREAVSGIGMMMGGLVVNLGARSWNFHISLPLSGWLAVAAIVVLGTTVSFSLFMQGVRDAGPVRSSMLSVTEPLSAAVFSAAWLGTSFSAVELAGFAAILATIFLLAKSE